MNLDAALSIASGGLANINAQLVLVSHNVANASTPGYQVENGTQQALSVGGIGMGVVTGPATRSVDDELQADLLRQNATVAALQTRQSALSAIDTVNGTPGQGNDLASLLGNLQNQFSTLLNDPGNATQQTQVVATAASLAQGINTLSDTYTSQRQAAQDATVSEVAQINKTLGAIGALSDHIIATKVSGQSTADLENQRDAQVASLSQLVDITTFEQPNGDLLIATGTGTQLPTHGQANPLSTSGANLQPGAYYPGGGVPPILLGGVDVTAALQGGQIGANIGLRDRTLPAYQGQLDEFARTLAGRFADQGLTLFTDASGAVPAGGGTPVQAGYVGFADEIQVNPAVQTNPALVRDGTGAIAGSPTGASAFTPNPAGGPAGFSTLLTRILNNSFGAQVQTGVAQPAPNTAGLGPTGTLNAPYAPPATLGSFATALVGSEAADSADVTGRLTTEQAVQTSFSTRLTSETGVNIDAEMSLMITLQNAYGANAKVMSAAHAMFAQLLAAVPT
ncbi:MAG TPA: flagellar hook-associated protein FlgK [Acetobacteraceae bacterium]|nr:flagellar hook-associated protein FlgK [Acetobacteraceae bacterium]